VEVAGETLVTETPSTTKWNSFKTINLGEITISEPGEHVVILRYLNPKLKPVNVKGIKLVPVQKKTQIND
jgi:hypothetical protein